MCIPLYDDTEQTRLSRTLFGEGCQRVTSPTLSQDPGVLRVLVLPYCSSGPPGAREYHLRLPYLCPSLLRSLLPLVVYYGLSRSLVEMSMVVSFALAGSSLGRGTTVVIDPGVPFPPPFLNLN